MALTRRDLLHKIAAGGATAVAAGTVAAALPQVAVAEEQATAPESAIGLLYDATKCIGCKTCVVACAEANNLAPDTRLDGLHQAPLDLNNFTKNIIRLYRTADGSEFSYVKSQCMHCVDPACVAGCSFEALRKEPGTGIVSWEGIKCSGCRYCQIACPYSVPRFEWEAFNPKVIKCELCKPRLAQGKEPACTTVCPTNAVVFGKRSALLAEAKRRIADHPGKYFENRVYGEHDAGGTQVLYLSHVPFEKIGLPNLGTESVPSRFLKWQHRVYKFLAIPAVLYVGMVGVMRGNFKHHQDEAAREQKETGLRPQL